MFVILLMSSQGVNASRRSNTNPPSEQCCCVSYTLYTADMCMYLITQCHDLIPKKISLNGKYDAKICTI